MLLRPSAEPIRVPQRFWVKCVRLPVIGLIATTKKVKDYMGKASARKKNKKVKYTALVKFWRDATVAVFWLGC